MTTQSDSALPKANHLRFAFGIVVLFVFALGLIGFQKYSNWKIDEERRKEQEAAARRVQRQHAADETTAKVHESLQANRPSKPAEEVVASKPVKAADVIQPVAETNQASTSTQNFALAPSKLIAESPVSQTVYPLPSGGSIVSGKVFLHGNVPPEKPIEEMRNGECGRLYEQVPTTRFYAIGPNHELADAYVRLMADNLNGAFAPSTNPVVINQVGCLFEPYIVGIQVGQPLQVINSDSMMHNVHFIPAAAGNKESNKAQMPKSQPFVYQFEKSEFFLKLKCDVHPWMFAYVVVERHPFFAVTDKDGSFTITNVPPGKYTIAVAHRKLMEKRGLMLREITVQPLQRLDVVFQLKPDL